MINIISSSSHHIISCAQTIIKIQGSHQQKTTHAGERTNRFPVANETKEKSMQCRSLFGADALHQTKRLLHGSTMANDYCNPDRGSFTVAQTAPQCTCLVTCGGTWYVVASGESVDATTVSKSSGEFSLGDSERIKRNVEHACKETNSEIR